MKFECVGCGQHLEADEESAGTMFTCPSCGNPIQAPGASLLLPATVPMTNTPRGKHGSVEVNDEGQEPAGADEIGSSDWTSATEEFSHSQVHAPFVANAPIPPATDNPILTRLASIGKVVGGLLLSIVCLAVILLILIFGGKFAIQVDPWTQALAGLSLLLVVPLSLILLIFRRTRGYGGLGIYLASWPVGLALWISCVAYAVAVSVTWTIVGIMMGGLGIVPIAAIMTLFRRDWSSFGGVIATVAITFALRATGPWIVSNSADDSIEIANRAKPTKPRPFVAVLRWIAVLPASLLACAAINAVIKFYSYMVGGSHHHFVDYAEALLAPIAFVYIGAIMAPSKHAATAIVLTVLLNCILLSSVGFLLYKMKNGLRVHDVWNREINQAVIYLLVSVICCIRIIKRDPSRLDFEERASAVP